MYITSKLAKVCVLSVTLLGLAQATSAEARGFLGIGDGRPGVLGIGDRRPGAFGVGDNRPGVMGVGDGRPGALGIGENDDRRPSCCRQRMSNKERRRHNRAHARAERRR